MLAGEPAPDFASLFFVLELDEVLELDLELLAEDLSVAEELDAAVEPYEECAQRLDSAGIDRAGIEMPGIDGIEVLRRVKQTNPHVEVIILTGHGSSDDCKTCMELGAFAYLQKPVDIDVLVAKIDDAARKRSSLEDQRIQEKMDEILRKKGW